MLRLPSFRSGGAVTCVVYTLLFASLAIGGASAGCAASHNSDTFGVDDSGAGNMFGDGGTGTVTTFDANTGTLGPVMGTCDPTLKTITITPPTVTTTVTYGSTPSVQQQFSASGTLADGTTQDVTGCAAWVTSAPDLATVMGGAFSTTTAGQYTITASSGSASGTAVVTVKLTGVANPSNVATAGLDGTPSGTAPAIAYPVDGALFPFHFGDLAFQVVPTAGQTLARIAFEGDAIDLKVYAPCTPIPNATTAGACSIALPADLEASLAGASEAVNMKETVRLASSTGTNLVESASIDVRWSSAPLPGSIYYWSAPPATMAAASEIVRMNLAAPGTPPEVFYEWLDSVPYAPPLSGGWACIGCHAISQDGKKMGIVLNGSAVGSDGQGSLFALVDIATRSPTAARITDDAGQQLLTTGFATFSTFSPDDTTMVQELQGTLYLRQADATLASTPLFGGLSEKQTEPFWSSKGDLLAFATWVPNTSTHLAYDSQDLNGNEIVNAQIWTGPVNGTTFGTPSVLVPRVTGATEYYPTISDDSAYVVFNESSCSGPPTNGTDGYGASPCDGYDDPSARLRMVAADGGAPLELDRASGRTSTWPAMGGGTWTNSWPRVSPTHTTFQGKTLYWVAFSSRRNYGAVLAGSQTGASVPQIWFAGIAVDPNGKTSGDPSFAPVWLPMQNSPTPEVLFDGGTAPPEADGGVTGNHLPQWVYKYVPYVPPLMPPPPPPR
jgi:hypothetical protein